MRRVRWLAGGLVVALVAAAAEPVKPHRRMLTRAMQDGWAQVQLDAPAQLEADFLWIGDGEGRPVPFLREGEVPPQEAALAVRQMTSGKDDDGAWVVEFELARVDGRPLPLPKQESDEWVSTRPLEIRLDVRRRVRMTVDVQAEGAWAAEVEASFDRFGQGWSRAAETWQVYDFGPGGRRIDFEVPRLAAKWRLRLQPLRGEIRGVRTVTAAVCGLTAPFGSWRSALGLTKDKEKEGRWVLTLPDGAQRVHAVHLALRGTVAPVRAQIERHADEQSPKAAVEVGAAQVWEMAGLKSRQGEVRLVRPVVAEQLALILPEGVEPVSAEAEIGGESLWFVAQKGEEYFLHLGGERRVAPGNLAALPGVLEARLPELLGLGAVQDDPHGGPRKVDPADVAKRWLPWLVAMAVAVLAGVALRIRRPTGAGE